MVDLNPDEVAAQFEPGGPIDAANQWVEAVLRQHDLAAGWPLMDESLRRNLVRAWLDANLSHPALVGEDPDQLCDALGMDDPTGHRLWAGFAVIQVGELLAAWNHVNLDHCSYASRPRLISPDLELIMLMDTGSPDPVIILEPTALPAIGFFMRHRPEGGWVIQGFGLGDSEAPKPEGV